MLPVLCTHPLQDAAPRATPQQGACRVEVVTSRRHKRAVLCDLGFGLVSGYSSYGASTASAKGRTGRLLVARLASM